MNWNKSKLKDLLVHVVDNRGKTPPLSDRGVELIETNALVGNNKFPNYGVVRKHVSRQTYETWFRSGHPIKGDILIATVGVNFGSVAIMRENRGCVAQNLVALRVNKEKINPDFLYYFLSWERTQLYLKNLDIGAAQPSIKVPHLLDIDVPIPDIQIQYKISAILSAYDDLIENNTRRIQILEEIAQLIYQEWFVNFRFPGYGKVRFVNSELGKIPEGWEVKPLEDIADLYRGRSYRSSDLQGNNCLPFFNLKNIQKGGGFRSEGTKLFSGKFSEEQIARTGDILIAVTDMTQERNVVARVARVPKLKFDFGIFSMDLVRIEPRGGISKDWLYCMLRYSTFSDEVKEYANGVNVLHLSPDRIKEYRVLVPANGLQKQFGQIIKNIFLLIDNFYEKNENLKKTRDILVPKLISGEIDVANLDIIAKEF